MNIKCVGTPVLEDRGIENESKAAETIRAAVRLRDRGGRERELFRILMEAEKLHTPMVQCLCLDHNTCSNSLLINAIVRGFGGAWIPWQIQGGTALKLIRIIGQGGPR